MPVRPVTDYLDSHNVNYHSYNHPPAVTAQEIAQSAHISGTHLAKTVIVNGDGELAMAVLPANQKINPQKLQAIMGVKQLRIASEYEFRDRFPLCEMGGMPPLGDLYGMKVYMERGLMNDDWIAFNAGTHTEVIKMDTGVFRRLVQPVVCNFGEVH
jgi:Ala-tRNA(Pro) deacylase